jgi:hypothetical protein
MTISIIKDKKNLEWDTFPHWYFSVSGMKQLNQPSKRTVVIQALVFGQ